MYIKHLFSSKDGTFILETMEGFILGDDYSLSFLNNKGEITKRLVTFHKAQDGFITSDNKYLVIRDNQTVIKTYDLQRKEEIASEDLGAKTIFYPYGFTLGQDENYFYMIIAKPEDFFQSRMLSDFYLELTPSFLQKRRVDNLKLVEESLLNDVFTDIKRFQKDYLFVRRRESLYSFDGQMVHNLNITSKDRFDFDEKNGLIVSMTEFGYRLFDDMYREILKYDILSEEQEVVDSEIFSVMNKNEIDFESDNYLSVYVEQLESYILLNGKYLICSIKENLTDYNKIRIIEVKKGKRLSEAKISEKIHNLYALKDNRFAIVTKDYIHVMEVVE